MLTAPAYRELVPRKDLEIFIHFGDQASHFEAARVEGTDYKRRLERELDELVYALYALTPEEKALVQAAAK